MVDLFIHRIAANRLHDARHFLQILVNHQSRRRQVFIRVDCPHVCMHIDLVLLNEIRVAKLTPLLRWRKLATGLAIVCLRRT